MASSTPPADPPPRPGTYALLLDSPGGARIRVGRLGVLRTEPGCYVYVGSALGPGGLAARVGRHRRVPERARWHVDYLRRATVIREVWYAVDPVRREHLWASALAADPAAAVPLAGFGASDCRCAAHLFLFRRPPSLDGFRRLLSRELPGHAPLRRAPGAGPVTSR